MVRSAPTVAKAAAVVGVAYLLDARAAPWVLDHAASRPSREAFGREVDMSQWGAQGMALGGAKAEQILTHYYRGIELTNVGGD